MSEVQTQCPECGSDSYDTIKHSWRDGVTPFDDYHVCCSCEHEWTENEFKQLGEQQ